MGIGAYTTTILVVDHGWRDLWTIPLAGVVAGGFGLAVRAAGDPLRRAVPRARDVRDPPLVHRAAQALFPLHRRERRQEPAQLHAEFGLHANPSVWFYAVCWTVALVMFPLSFWIVARALRTLAARGPRQRDRVDGERHLDRDASRQPLSASRPSSAASPAALFAIGITYVNPDTFPIDLSILLLVGIVVGGAGSLTGMLFGALFVEFIRISWGPALLAEVSHVHHINTRAPGSGFVIYGLVLLLCLYVAPAGAAGVARQLRSAFRSRRNRASHSVAGPV